MIISERHLHAEGYFILDDVAVGSNPTSPTTIRGIAQPGRARKISLSEHRRQSDSFSWETYTSARGYFYSQLNQTPSQLSVSIPPF